jgi:hypothetical protein
MRRIRHDFQLCVIVLLSECNTLVLKFPISDFILQKSQYRIEIILAKHKTCCAR